MCNKKNNKMSEENPQIAKTNICILYTWTKKDEGEKEDDDENECKRLYVSNNSPTLKGQII